jgi:hypothetical protein
MTSRPVLGSSALFATGLLLVGCGASVASDERVAADPRARAVAVVERLQDAGLPVTDVVACVPPAPAPVGHPTPSAVAFDDMRVSTGADRHVIREGGVVEVFDSAAQVQARVRELDSQTLAAQAYGFDEGGHALHAERRLRVGPVLLRLTGELSHKAARAYSAALVTIRPSTNPTTLPDGTEVAPCST